MSAVVNECSASIDWAAGVDVDVADAGSSVCDDDDDGGDVDRNGDGGDAGVCNGAVDDVEAAAWFLSANSHTNW